MLHEQQERAPSTSTRNHDFSLLNLRSYLRAHPSVQVVDQGLKKTLSFPLLDEAVQAAVERLQLAGVEAGMRVGVLADNQVGWIVYDIALIELRAVVVALSPEAVDGELADAVAAFELHLLVTDTAAPTPRPTWWVELDAPHPEERVRTARLELDASFDTPAWVFSSGSTGRVKCITTRRDGVESLVTAIGDAFSVGESDRFVVFLPMASFQQRFLIYASLWLGVSLMITRPPGLLAALRSFSPTIILAPPALFTAVAVRVDNVSGARRWLLDGALRLADILGEGSDGRLRRMVSREVRAFFGGEARLLLTGMAPSSPETLSLFERLGLPICEVYGMTECGMIAWNTPGQRRRGSVGQVVAGVSVEIAEDGEVIVHSPALVSSGYRFGVDAEDERKTYLSPTRISTGDIGRLDEDGFLFLVGRKKNAIITPGGRKLHPEVFERALTALSLVQDVVVVQRDGELGAVVVPREPDTLDRAALRAALEAFNKTHTAKVRLSRFAVSEPFSRENGLLTTNLKVNRRAIAARYAEELERV